jgi:hypothetical protein
LPEPRAAYVSTMLDRFVEREPIKSVLTGFASVIRMLLQVQEQALPAFTHVDQDQSASATEPAEVVRVYRLIGQLQRLIDHELVVCEPDRVRAGILRSSWQSHSRRAAARELRSWTDQTP